jgi:hypothetical protein
MQLADTAKLRANFFKDVDGKQDLVEIVIIGDPNTLIKKVSPDHVRTFPREWEAYQSGQTEIKIDGTPLTEVPGVDRNLALALKLKGVRTAEELAALDEAAATGLGMNMRTFVSTAKNFVKLKAYEKQEAAQAAMLAAAVVEEDKPRRGRPPKAVEVEDASE